MSPRASKRFFGHGTFEYPPDGVSSPRSDWVSSPRMEAQQLYQMVERGTESVESVHALIAIPLRIDHVLTAFAHRDRAAASMISHARAYRCEVLREFDQVVAARGEVIH